MIVQLRSRKNGYALIDTETGDEVDFLDFVGISDLTALAGADLTTADVLPIADVSAGQTKKVTYADLQARSIALAKRVAGGVLRGTPVTNGCFAQGTSRSDDEATGGTGTSRAPHKILRDCTNLRLIYTNWRTPLGGGGDVDNTNQITVKASVKIAGVVYRMPFGGLLTGTPDGGGIFVSNPLPIHLAAGTSIDSLTFTTGTWYANRASFAASGTGGFVDTTDATGTGTVADSIAFLFAPAAITGEPYVDCASVLIAGDSVFSGYGDPTAADYSGYVSGGTPAGGYASRALTAINIGHTNIARAGDFASRFAVASGHWRRMTLATGHTHAVIGFGRNDLNGGDGYLTVAGNNITNALLMSRRLIKAIMMTVTPYTTSSDAWATVGNQTVQSSAAEAQRVLYNNWVRAGCPVNSSTLAAVAVGTANALLAGSTGHPVIGYVDGADGAESARNSGKWVGGTTDDGIHPNSTGAAAIAANVQTALGTLLAS